MPLWAGQSANLSTCTEVSVFLNSLVEEVSEIAGPLNEWSAKRREKSNGSREIGNEHIDLGKKRGKKR
jgi:hypothetical protein